jgi:hypothetical protein
MKQTITKHRFLLAFSILLDFLYPIFCIILISDLTFTIPFVLYLQVKGLAGVLGINVENLKSKSDRIAALCDSINVLL